MDKLEEKQGFGATTTSLMMLAMLGATHGEDFESFSDEQLAERVLLNCTMQCSSSKAKAKAKLEAIKKAVDTVSASLDAFTWKEETECHLTRSHGRRKQNERM